MKSKISFICGLFILGSVIASNSAICLASDPISDEMLISEVPSGTPVEITIEANVPPMDLSGKIPSVIFQDRDWVGSLYPMEPGLTYCAFEFNSVAQPGAVAPPASYKVIQPRVRSARDFNKLYLKSSVGLIGAIGCDNLEHQVGSDLTLSKVKTLRDVLGSSIIIGKIGKQ